MIMYRLKLSNNRRFLIKEDGTPFIWLADTCWTMPQRMKWDDVDYYMRKRKEQGFSVLQIVALDPEQDMEIRNPVGDKALLNNDLLSPNEKYFAYLDFIIEKAKEYELYILLLPAWGELVVGHNWMGEFSKKIVTQNNAYQYGQWIGNRYKDEKHIIWCLGGDRQPIHLGVDYKDVWRKMAEGLIKGVKGKDLRYDQEDPAWEELMITYHACHEAETGECSTMSYWTDNEKWISFIMLQSGHGLNVENYKLVEKEYNRSITMPVFDGEPAYECMPTSWPVIKDFHKDWSVRKRAYSSLFAGSFGHTYGHASVWCMISEKEKDMARNATWFEALGHPGAEQIKILRNFLETVELSECMPCQERINNTKYCETKSFDHHNQVCCDTKDRYTLIYMPSGGQEIVEVTVSTEDTVNIWWFNPRDGVSYKERDEIVQNIGMFNERCSLSINIKAPEEGPEKDWVCIIEKENSGLRLPILSRSYIDQSNEKQLRKVFEW